LRSSIRTFLVVLALSVILAISCTPAKSTVPPPAPAGPKYGGTLHLIIAATLQNVDPVKQTGPHSWALARLYSDNLIAMEGNDNNDVTIVPRLAKSWEMAPDAKSYTFHLNEGIKFQNVPPVNGRECTSADIKYSFDRIRDTKSGSMNVPLFVALDHIDTPDKYTVVFVMKTPDPGFLFNLCSGVSVVCAKEVIDRDGDASKVMIGTGPFISNPEETIKDSKYTFRKNPDYYQKGLPYVDRVEVTVMPEEQVQTATFRSGAIDEVIATKSVYDNLKPIPNIGVSFPVETLASAVYYSVTEHPEHWKDVRVRQALMYAIDYDGLIKAAANGAGYRSWWLDPKFKDWGAPQLADMPKQDIPKAKALLAEAGFPDGFTCTFSQHMARLDAWGGTVEPLAAMFKLIGVDAKIQQQDHPTFIANARAGKYDLMSYVTWISPALDPDGGLGLSRQYGTFQKSGTFTPQMDELVTAQRMHLADPTARKADIKQLFTVLDKEQPCIPLYVQWKYHVTQPWIKGWKGGDVLQQLGYHEIQHVWIDK
jgi:peptide/nickel transport system substrate-binding protein